MIDGQTTVTVAQRQVHVVTLNQGQRTTTIEVEAKPVFSVIAGGLQGPVGTVAEEVLSAVARAEAVAAEAKGTAEDAQSLSEQNQSDLDDVVTQMTNRFNYHAGAISAM